MPLRPGSEQKSLPLDARTLQQPSRLCSTFVLLDSGGLPDGDNSSVLYAPLRFVAFSAVAPVNLRKTVNVNEMYIFVSSYLSRQLSSRGPRSCPAAQSNRCRSNCYYNNRFHIRYLRKYFVSTVLRHMPPKPATTIPGKRHGY